MSRTMFAALMATMLGGVASLHAAPIVTAGQGSFGTFSVSNSDLLHGLTPALTGDELYGSSVLKLNDGDVYNPGGPFVTDGSFTTSNGSSVVFTLATTGLGYDITSIVSLTGYQLRTEQKFDVHYAPVGSDSFTLLGQVLGDEDLNTVIGGDGGEVRVTIASDNTDPLATGVGSLRFTFYDSPNETVYREIDVFGVATVPEPSSMALLAFGMLSMWLFRRKR